jgi:MFS family permease
MFLADIWHSPLTHLQLFCALYYIPFYFTSIRFEPPTQAGLDIFPVTCFLLPGSIVISLATTRTGRYRWAIWSGWVVTAIGCGLLVLLDAETKTPVWAVILAIFGIGHGMLLTSVNVGIQAVSRVEDAGRAAAMYAFMRTLGMSIGVAVGGTVFQNVMTNKLDKLGLPESIAKNSEAFVAAMALMDPKDPQRIAAVESCKHSVTTF